MPRKSRNKHPPGDIRLDPRDVALIEQPLSEDGKVLLKRGYELFDAFHDNLREVHEDMRVARQMRRLRSPERSMTAPPSMTLNSCIDNVIADQIDNMPEAVLIPEREETEGSADEMTDVVGFVLYQAGWPGKYNQLMEDATVAGTGVAQVFWDEDMMNGEGMVNVIAWHPEDFYPDPMYENIQDGRACFKATLTTVAWVREHYPDVAEYVKGDAIRPEDSHGSFVEAVFGDEKVTLLEYWYKRYDAKKKRNRVHMAQMAGNTLLYSTELGIGCSKSEYAEGVYAHGLYPFVLYKYKSVFREPFGTGMTHDHAGTQNAIDRCQKYIDDNARASSIVRHFIRRGSGVSIDDVADLSKTIIEWDGNDIREVMQTVQASPLNNQVFQYMQFMVDAMKEDSGQNAFNRGETSGGVTANSAIQSLLTQGNKITRWHVAQFKDSFREMIEQVLWVLSEYMTPGRQLRIVGGNDSDMGMAGRLITVKAPNAEGDKMPKPAYSVRVQANRASDAANRNNDLVMQAAEVSAQGGRPIPAPQLIDALQGIPNKGRIVKMLQQVGTVYDELAAAQNQMEQMQQMIQAKDAVIRSDAQAMGAPSIARALQNVGGNPNYDALMQTTKPATGAPAT